jgi:hypothetical protein
MALEGQKRAIPPGTRVAQTAKQADTSTPKPTSISCQGSGNRPSMRDDTVPQPRRGSVLGTR